MPELIRSLVSRARIYFKDRRRSPRLRVRLLVSVSVHRSSNGISSRQGILKGHTRDISANGLSLNLPQAHLDGRHLAAEERRLQLNLELPDGPTSMVVIPRRYERLDEAELGCSNLIGVRIVQITDEDRKRYSSFIARGLEGSS
jgi:PilZ domain-containing protein